MTAHLGRTQRLLCCDSPFMLLLASLRFGSDVAIVVNERAAARSWFVPAAKHWVDVENGNILRNMLAQILTGKLSVKQAAASASDNITSVLNGS